MFLLCYNCVTVVLLMCSCRYCCVTVVLLLCYCCVTAVLLLYCCSVTALLPFCRELCCKFATPWALLLVGVLHVCAVRPLVRPRGRVVGHVKKCTCLPPRNLKCCMFLRLNFFADLRTWDIRNVERFIRDLFDMERLKKENMRSNYRYTRTKNKLMMVMGGGLASRMLVMESLNIFSGAYEDELRACENLGKCCEDMKDSGNVCALLNELEVIEEDFTELEGLVRGYLSNASNSSVKERTELLKEELSKREVELSRIEQGIERAHAECKRQFGHSLRSETSDKPIPKPRRRFCDLQLKVIKRSRKELDSH